MSGKCLNKNPLQRSGVSQYQRVLRALLPESAEVDERKNEDLILFAKKYAEYLNYYNNRNEIDGDWTPFMKMDVSVVLASIIKQDTKKYSVFLTDLYAYIATKDASSASGKNDLKNHYKNIFDFIFTLFYRYDEFLTDLPDDFEFTAYLETIIESKMSALYLKLNKYYEASIAATLFDPASSFITTNIKSPVAIKLASELIVNKLNDAWYADITSPDVLSFTVEFSGTTEANKIKNIIDHNLFKGLIEQTIKTFTNILSVSSNYFEQTLSDFPTHTPHYALYLTFIKLFRYAQNDLNKFTGKHLDFYYKEVLQLSNKAAEPDNVHLLFELTKNAAPTLLAANTAFKAGKNEDKQELFYALTKDIVVNSGAVKSLKAIYSEIVSASSVSVYASKVVNSQDGEGAELTSANKSWRPFGLNTNAKADLGFAIAHSNLYLQEGVRTITATLHFDINLSTDDIKFLAGIKAQITGEKEWIELSVTSALISATSAKDLIIIIEIGNDKGAIVGYSEETHLLQMDTKLPVLKLLLNYEISKHTAVDFYANHKLLSVKLDVAVTGLKNLAIQNEVSALDAAKSFPIFGNSPHLGSSFVFGSNEAFLKNKQGPVNATLKLEWDHIDKLQRINYAAPTTNFVDKPISLSFLKNGIWSVDAAQTYTLFKHTDSVTVDSMVLHASNLESIPLVVPQNSAVDYNASKTEQFNVASRNGYVKIELRGTSDFGHSDYMQRVTQAAIDSGTIPPEPYTPSVKAISLNYSATATIDLTSVSNETTGDDFGRFFHITPFGHAQQHLSFLETGKSFSLLPTISNEGELYIGIEKFSANQNLNLLFKVSDGSADPTKNVQDIDWYYLAANNQWIPFDEDSLVDETNNFTKTGIINFPFPSNATELNSLMGETLFWIRGTVKKDTLALCSLIQVDAQAAKAVFTDYSNIGNYYKGILPPQTISKMVISNSAIKKITQPYTSFDGKLLETNSTFYNRVSERLRHKQRAITIWDYERLVLEKFQQLYKVKCINHAEVRMNESPAIDNELAPGHVLIVPVPSLNNKNAVDPLKPQTDLGTLVEIEHYLRQYTSPHVTIQVKNAKFEEIQLDFRVKFLGDDTAYYHDVLLAEIEQYLSPWAYDAATDIEFGGRITKSVLINFIEERSYVDYITCFKMFHIVDGLKSVDVEDAIATTSRTVFVSYSGNEALSDPKHKIDYINIDCDC